MHFDMLTKPPEGQKHSASYIALHQNSLPSIVGGVVFRIYNAVKAVQSILESITNYLSVFSPLNGRKVNT